MKNIPNKIYLQTALEDNGETCNNFSELDNVSWCTDNIYEDDLEFISSVFILRRIEELEKEIEDEDSEYSITSCRFAIKELKNLLK